MTYMTVINRQGNSPKARLRRAKKKIEEQEAEIKRLQELAEARTLKGRVKGVWSRVRGIF